MEKLQKEEELEDQLDKLRDYGFNVDELVDMMNDDEENEEE